MSQGSERRAAQRFEIFAQASVLSGEDMYLMSVRNISADGAFLEGRAKEHPELKPGVTLEIVVSAAKPGMDDDDVINISCTGQVVRVELGTAAHPGGFGITLEPSPTPTPSSSRISCASSPTSASPSAPPAPADGGWLTADG